MELSLSTAIDRNTLHLGLTGSSQAVAGSTAAYEQVGGTGSAALVASPPAGQFAA